ncbi:MAG TPA: hydrophobe/amphiphile efflux-3 (HAE3) family transporter [Acidimicrobiia bacterium]
MRARGASSDGVVTRLWCWWAGVVDRHHRWVLGAALAATALVALGLPRLEFKSSQDTMIPSGSQVARDNRIYQGGFGGDPIIVLFEGDIRTLFTPENRAELTRLEEELAGTGLYHAVISPLTSLRFAAAQLPIAPDLALSALVREQEAAETAAREEAAERGASPSEQDQAAQAARDEVADAFDARTAADGARLAAAGQQSLDNPAFVDFLIFGADGSIRPTFASAFPDSEHALMVVRLAGNLSLDDQGVAATTAVELTEARDFEGVTALPTGPPLLVKEINDGMSTDMARLGALAVIVMIVILLVVFRARWRLLSLPLVLLGTAWAFGLMGFLGVPLTMVTISGLPILIGLGVDFAIQTHSRYEEEAARADHAAALTAMFVRLGPALWVAMIAGVAGFLALRISRVPMIRDFGVMLSVGVAVLLVTALALAPSVLAWRDRRRSARGLGPATARPPRRPVVEPAVAALTSVARGRPLVVLGVTVLVGAAGIVAGPRTAIQSDAEKFIPQDTPVLQDLRYLREVADSSGDLGLMVTADDVLRPDVLEWMARFEATELREHDELFRSNSVASIAATITGSTPTPADVEAILGVAPPAILDTFVSDDHRRANIIFAIGSVSLQEEKELIAEMRADMETELRPPPGVRVVASGLAVVGIETIDALSSNRSAMAYAAVAAVLVWLLLAFRGITRAVLVLIPVVAAVGAAWTVIYLAGIEINSLTALSSPLVVAISTQFSVLVVERYLEERRNGRGPEQAVVIATRRIGRAFTASGLTTAGGFAVLALSGFPLLSNFGIVVSINILVALLCTLVLLPPLLVWRDHQLVRTTAHRPRVARDEPAPVAVG